MPSAVRVSRPEDAPAVVVDAVVLEQGLRGGVVRVRRDGLDLRVDVRVEEELAGVDDLAAGVGVVGERHVRVHPHMDVDGARHVVAGPDRGDRALTVLVGRLPAAQEGAVVLLVVAVAADVARILTERIAVPDLDQGVGERCTVVRGVDDREGVLDLDSFFVLPDVLADEGAVEGVRTLGDLGGEGADGGGRGRRGGGRGRARRGGLRGGLLGGERVGRGEPGDREATGDGDGAAADEDPAPLDTLVPTVLGGLLARDPLLVLLVVSSHG